MSEKIYLLTGGSGAIGSAILPLLLNEKDTIIYLLLRSKNVENLDLRVSKLCEYWGISKDELKGRVIAINGDIKKKEFGIEKSIYKKITSSVTNIIHSAGNVRMNLSIEEALEETVTVTKYLMEIYKDCQAFTSEVKLDYVSTIGVSGKLEGEINEIRLEHDKGFHNNYELSKYQAELILWKEVDEGANISIHRPSMVIGDSISGKIIHFQVFYYLIEFLMGKYTLGYLPNCKKHCLDIVPVDFVANAIVISSKTKESIGKVFHLCSGYHSPKLEQIVSILKSQNIFSVYFVSTRLFLMVLSLIKVFLKPDFKKKVKTLPYFLAYLQSQQVFVNKKTCEFFESYDLHLKPIQDSLIPILTYYKNTKK